MPTHDTLQEAYENHDPEDDTEEQSFDYMVHYPNGVTATLLLHSVNKFSSMLGFIKACNDCLDADMLVDFFHRNVEAVIADAEEVK